MGINKQSAAVRSYIGPEYISRGQNVLQQIFKDHFDNFINQYGEKYAATYGNYRIDRIIKVVEEFLKCGIYSEGVVLSTSRSLLGPVVI